MRLAPARWIWLALIVLQLVWFGWLAPIKALGPLTSALLVTVPLLLPAWWIWRLNVRGLVVGGMLLLVYFCIGVAEAWAVAEVRVPALLQVGLTVAYYAVLGQLRPQRRSADRR